jgi:adenylate kinase
MEMEANLDVKSVDDIDTNRGKIYFINNVNTTVGHSLTEEMRNDHLLLGDRMTHTILGTRCEKSNWVIPSGVNKIVKKHKLRHWKKYLINSDVMVFDMLTSSFDEITNAIHVLKTQDYDDEKVLVLISSVVTWVNTPPNRKLSKQVEDSTDTESEVDRPQDVDNSGLNEAGEMIYPFEESDIEKRIPSPKYQSLKTLENAALAAMKTKENLKVYVLCAGVVYGQGEDAFYPHFKQAWLQKLLSLPIIGTGDNVIPTIHVKDLSNMVKRIAEVKPLHHYCFAIDRALNQTQREIVESISKGVGSGQVHNIELDDVVYEEWAEFLTLNIRMKSSTVFEDLVVDNPDENENNDFPWH